MMILCSGRDLQYLSSVESYVVKLAILKRLASRLTIQLSQHPFRQERYVHGGRPSYASLCSFSNLAEAPLQRAPHKAQTPDRAGKIETSYTTWHQAAPTSASARREIHVGTMYIHN